MKLNICDLVPGVVDGVEVLMLDDENVYKETYFEWTASNLTTTFQKKEIGIGKLVTWHHTIEYKEIEYHVDKEAFYFYSGNAIMLFIDIKNGKPDMASAQLVRIKKGTQIVIKQGKGHFVPIAEASEPVCAIVISPKMEAIRIDLEEEIGSI